MMDPSRIRLVLLNRGPSLFDPRRQLDFAGRQTGRQPFNEVVANTAAAAAAGASGCIVSQFVVGGE